MTSPSSEGVAAVTTRREQLRAAKQRQRERDRSAGFRLYQIKLPSDLCDRLKAGMREPRFVERLHAFLREIKAIGFSGVQNFPTVGLIDGLFRQNLEETGMSFSKEVEMIGIASELDLLTTPYVFSPEEAVEMAAVGADVLVAHMGLTTKGSIGARTAKTLDESVAEIQAIHDAAKKERDQILVICHGGPLSEPDDVRYVLERTEGIVGFFGAISVERLPTERAITAQVMAFKQIESLR